MKMNEKNKHDGMEEQPGKNLIDKWAEELGKALESRPKLSEQRKRYVLEDLIVATMLGEMNNRRMEPDYETKAITQGPEQRSIKFIVLKKDEQKYFIIPKVDPADIKISLNYISLKCTFEEAIKIADDMYKKYKGE
jgi:hypothetical protein